MVCLLGKCLLLALFSIVRSHLDYYDGANYEDYQHYNLPLPSFLSHPKVFYVEVGGNVTFPCDMENEETYVMIFKQTKPNRRGTLLFVGDVKITLNKHLKKRGNSFTLTRIQKDQAGQYECLVGTRHGIRLVHTLHVQYPAKAEQVTPALQLVAEGSTVTLQCNADGNPKANITWSRQQGHLPLGQSSEEGQTMTLENVDHDSEGTYICTAFNGIGQPSSASMTIEVEHPPEIITEQVLLHTGEGDEATLSCLVHGRPSPTVTWTKGGRPINSSTHIISHVALNRHTLTINHVRDEDYGDYICTAVNKLGFANITLSLAGSPKTPRITSSHASGEKNSYTLTWETESCIPVIIYRLQYRKYQADMAGQPQPHWVVQFHSGLNGEHTTVGSMHFMSHTIPNLDAATDYEVLVVVRNRVGWSRTSTVFRFYTKKGWSDWLWSILFSSAETQVPSGNSSLNYA